MFRPAAMHLIEIQGLQARRYGPALPGADAPPVKLPDRRNLGGGAGKEGFVRNIDLIARDALLLHGTRSSPASVMMLARVIPSNADVKSGVYRMPSRTMKIIPPLPSVT